MLEQRDRVQQTTPVALLSPLLAHPEFRQGVADAHATFLNDYEPGPLTEEDMIDDVEEWLSREGFAYDKTSCQVRSSKPRTYLYNLGLLIGNIDKGLTDA